MLPARPRITLLAPRQIVVGTSAVLTVQLDTPRPTPIDYVDLFVVGRTFSGAGDREVLRLGARLRGPSRLEKGRTELACRIDVPASIPPSYEGTLIRVRHEARVHVSVPYWPDASGAYQISMRPPPRVSSIDETLLFSSASGGAPLRGPYAELSLKTRSGAPGDVLSGAIALYNVAQCRYDRVTVAIQTTELLAGAEVAGPAWSIELTTPIDEGVAVPFALRIPETSPSMEVRGVRVKHSLVVVAHAGWRELLRMPIPIDLVPDPVREDRARRAPPLGDERIRAIWERVAETEGMSLESDALVLRDGNAVLSVRRDRSGPAPRLIAEVKHPTLGLELRTFPRSRFRLRRGPRSMHEGIDARLAFEARSMLQGEAWLARVSQALDPLLSSRVVLHELTDVETSLAFADSGTTEEALRAMAKTGKGLAAILVALHPTVPLPAGLPDPAWPALATRLGASLVRGNGLMTWEDEDARLTVRPLLDENGAVVALRMAREERTPLEVGAPLTATQPEAFSSLRDEARRAASALTDAGAELHVTSEEVALTATGWPLDELPGRVERALTSLARLSAALRPGRGPFR